MKKISFLKAFATTKLNLLADCLSGKDDTCEHQQSNSDEYFHRLKNSTSKFFYILQVSKIIIQLDQSVCATLHTNNVSRCLTLYRHLITRLCHNYDFDQKFPN